jgi:hypothetical protein
VHAIADGVNEGGYHKPELGAEYCEQEPEIPNAEPEIPEDFEDSKFNLILGCILYPFYKLHIILLEKHGRISTLVRYD